MSRFDKEAEGWDHSERRQRMATDIANTIIASDILQPSMQLLDFGAGTGLLTQHIAPYVHKITALDLSEKMLEQLSQNAIAWHGAEIVTVHSDILNYQTETLYDGIISSMSMHHVQDIEALFKHFSYLLKEQGFVAIADLESEDGTFHSNGNEGVYHFGFDEKKLTDIVLTNGFKQVSFQQVHKVHKEQSKIYPVFLMLAIKSNDQ